MIGVLEGFFGPAWPPEQRLAYAEFIQRHGGDFYIYAPKSDPYLRKRWHSAYPEEKRRELKNLSRHFRENKLFFGVGFSPFELHNDLSSGNKARVREKIDELNEIGIDLLGIFLDDMKGCPKLAAKQLEIVELIRPRTSAKILFCPTYYSDDPILDKVFGPRPEGYLEEIAKLPPEIDIMWTGPKVLSAEISSEHLQKVSAMLGRRPFIWDNLYANDGPKNCRFLKLFAPARRDPAAAKHAAGWALNPMNQAELAKINFLTYLYFFAGREEPLTEAVKHHCPEGLTRFILEHAERFSTNGLDGMSSAEKEKILTDLTTVAHPAAADITHWLQGGFIVGNECLTD